jgi:hypothetical protein
MAFDVGAKAVEERAKPRWVKYVSPDGGVVVHVKLKPRDAEVVKRLDKEFPQEERLTRAGHVRERSEELARQWLTGYLLAHVLDWEITRDGERADITAEVLELLPKGMRHWMADRSSVDDLSAHEVESPFRS